MTLRQLRIYTVQANDRDAVFHRWDTQARPLMQEHGFTFVEQWEGRVDPVSQNLPIRVLRLLLTMRHPSRPRSASHVFDFGYLLAWEDETQMRCAWDAFLDDPRWRHAKSITQRAAHGEPVVMVTDRLLHPRSK